jgi:hypothetical protein
MEFLTDTDKVKAFFPKTNRPTVKIFLTLVSLVMVARSVCLSKLSDYQSVVIPLKKRTSQKHFYKKLQRFFRLLYLNRFINGLTIFILSYLPENFKDRYLILDRSEWKANGQTYNLLFIGVLIGGVCLPVYSLIVSDQRGNSSQELRIGLLKKLKRFVSLRASIVLGDREFLGWEWLDWLASNEIYFAVRLRKKAYWKEASGNGLTDKFIRKLRRKAEEKGFSYQVFERQGQRYCLIVAIHKHSRFKDSYIYLITNLKSPSEALKAYGKRWRIETMFKCMKTNGFNMEKMNLTDPRKIRLMMGVICTACFLCILQGILQIRKNPPPLKHYKTPVPTDYPPISVFRIGLTRWIEQFTLNHSIQPLFDFQFFEPY